MEINDVSIFYNKISGLATLANENALPDLERLLLSLQLWNEELPTVYLACTSGLEKKLPDILKKLHYTGNVKTNTCLDSYEGLRRPDMERAPSKQGYPNLWFDFMLEKTHLIDWALEEQKGVLFCDADICWLSQLPEIPVNKTLGVSPHRIRQHDEEKYGVYNGGFLWTNSKAHMELWREKTKTSRFFEQMSIQDVVASLPKEDVYVFDTQYNYGWWRMFQSSRTPEEQKIYWSVFRSATDETNSGIRVENKPLACIHTHFSDTQDIITVRFNKFVIEKLELLANQKTHKAQKKIKTLLKYIK